MRLIHVSMGLPPVKDWVTTVYGSEASCNVVGNPHTNDKLMGVAAG